LEGCGQAIAKGERVLTILLLGLVASTALVGQGVLLPTHLSLALRVEALGASAWGTSTTTGGEVASRRAPIELEAGASSRLARSLIKFAPSTVPTSVAAMVPVATTSAVIFAGAEAATLRG